MGGFPSPAKSQASPKAPVVTTLTSSPSTSHGSSMSVHQYPLDNLKKQEIERPIGTAADGDRQMKKTLVKVTHVDRSLFDMERGIHAEQIMSDSKGFHSGMEGGEIPILMGGLPVPAKRDNLQTLETVEN